MADWRFFSVFGHASSFFDGWIGRQNTRCVACLLGLLLKFVDMVSISFVAIVDEWKGWVWRWYSGCEST